MLPRSLHWFLNLFITLGGRVAGRDNIKKMRKDSDRG